MNGTISGCLIAIGEGVYRCQNLGIVIHSRHRRIRCVCDSGTWRLRVIPQQDCPLAPILTAIPAQSLHRLHRCLAANCQLIHRVDGRILCVGRGRRCEWLGEWARFLAGGEGCPHWEAIASADA